MARTGKSIPCGRRVIIVGFRIPVAAEVHCDICKESHDLSMDLYTRAGAGVGTAGERGIVLPTGWNFWTNRWYQKKVLCPNCCVGRVAAS